jgi:hypothetical protein
LLWGTRKAAKGEDELQVRVAGLSGLVNYCSERSQAHPPVKAAPSTIAVAI